MSKMSNKAVQIIKTNNDICRVVYIINFQFKKLKNLYLVYVYIHNLLMFESKMGCCHVLYRLLVKFSISLQKKRLNFSNLFELSVFVLSIFENFREPRFKNMELIVTLKDFLSVFKTVNLTAVNFYTLNLVIDHFLDLAKILAFELTRIGGVSLKNSFFAKVKACVISSDLAEAGHDVKLHKTPLIYSLPLQEDLEDYADRRVCKIRLFSLRRLEACLSFKLPFETVLSLKLDAFFLILKFAFFITVKKTILVF